MDRPEHVNENRVRMLSESVRAYEEDEIDLLDYVEVIVRRRWMIFWIVVICTLASALFSRSRPIVYQVEAHLLASQQRNIELVGGTAQIVESSGGYGYLEALKGLAIQRSMLNRRVVIRSNGGRDSVSLHQYFGGKTKQALEGLAACSIFSQGEVGVISIAVTLRDSVMAASVANAYVEELILFFTVKQQRRTQEDLQFIQSRIEEVEKELWAAQDSLTTFQKSNISIQHNPELETRHTYLRGRVELKRSIYHALMNKYEIVRIDERKTTPTFEVLSLANPDDAVPSTAAPRTVVLISGMVGLMVSICLAFLIEYTVRIHRAGRIAPILNELGKDVERVRRLLGRKE